VHDIIRGMNRCRFRALDRSVKFLAACFLALPLLAQSATVPPGDVTGIWFDALHPGWGLGLTQQNDTVFATLFIYNANGMPLWIVGTLQGGAVNFDPCGSMTLSGPLYRTQWPLFGSATNPQGSMQVQTAGTIAVTIATVPVGSPTSCDRNSAALQYSIDGVQSTATVTRQTWSSNQARLYGQYAAGLVLNYAPFPCPPNPPPIETFIPAGALQLSMNIAADGTGVRLFWGTGIDTVCQISGTYSQGGQLAAISGAVSCGPVGNALTSLGQAQVSNLYVSDAGFVGNVVLATNCPIVGTISGARSP
jgi:hypothetical protein